MAGEDKEATVQGQTSGGEPQKETEPKETLPGADVQQVVSRIIDERLADVRAELEASRRAAQGKIDKDIARIEKQREKEREALQTFVRQQLEAKGATTEELASFEKDYGHFAEGLSAQEKASLYEEMVAHTEEERLIREAQNSFVKKISKAFEVEIPIEHPELKSDAMKYTPEQFDDSVIALAKKLQAEKAKEAQKQALTKAAESGVLSSLGTGPGGTAPPLAGVKTPDEAYEEWIKQGRPMPKRKK